MKYRRLNKAEFMEYIKPLVQDNEVLHNYFEGVDYVSNNAKVRFDGEHVQLYINDCLVAQRPDFNNEINYID